jgi:hypothetical protein
MFGEGKGTVNGAASQVELLEALAAYLTPEMVKAINDARVRLGQYIPDAEAEALSEHIAYWDYAVAPKGSGETA